MPIQNIPCIVPAATLKVLPSLDVRAPVYIELEPAGLNYVRAAMQCSYIENRELREFRNDGVHWRQDRKVWLAKKKVGVKTICKSFKPDCDDELAVQEAKCKALSWRGSADEDGVEAEEGDDNHEDGDILHASAGT